MKILVLSTTYSRNAKDWSVPFVHALNKQLAKKHDVAVVSSNDYESEKYEVLDKVRIYRFSYFFPRKLQRLVYHGGMMESFKSSFLAKIQMPFFMLSFILKSLSVIRRDRPDIVHCHWSLSALVAILLRPFHKKSIILTVHGADIRAMPKYLNKFILKRVSKVTTAHSEMIELMKGMGYNKAVDVKNMFDYEKFTDTKDGKTITFIGRLVPMKDPMTFVKAARLLPDEQFVLVGDGHLMDDVKGFVSQNKLENVLVAGGRSDTETILASSKIFCALSPLENCFSTTIIESMYVGIPPIITKAGLTDKHFTHLKDAYLIPPNDPQALAQAIEKLSSDEKLRNLLAHNGKIFLKQNRFLPEDIIEDIEKVYSSV